VVQGDPLTCARGRWPACSAARAPMVYSFEIQEKIKQAAGWSNLTAPSPFLYLIMIKLAIFILEWGSLIGQ
jgi:hypothetical protein